MSRSSRKPDCPCGSAKPLDLCCRRFISGGAVPETPEELMRSRYTAYALGDEQYLKKTWYPGSMPPGGITLDRRAVKWVRLDVIRHEEDGPDGVVEFVAHCKVNGRAQKLHETSRFLKEGGRWYYLDGTFSE